MNFVSNILFLFTLLTLTNFSWAAFLNLYCGSIDDFTTAELEAPLPLLESECFNKDFKTLIYAFGFTSSPKADTTESVVKSFITLGGYNVFVIDWEEEAGSPSIVLDVITYPASAVPNTIKIGKACGRALNIMSSSLNLSTTYLVGHSLGAHLVGHCGKELQTFNKNVSRITGLDPAGPLFDGPHSLDGLVPSSAEFVDVLHTNSGFFGTTEQLGQVDVWFNCADKYQPRCAFESIITEDACSHQFVCFYFAEAVLNSTAFAAQPYETCEEWLSSDATPEADDIIYIGEYTDRRAHGNYYLRTDRKYPFGLGPAGLGHNFASRDIKES